ncbi:hypothetical protein UY456_00915 [Paenibacillus polymyxa]|uniref:hypothetical protein n=1 Tax=Paenibacillus polymyxa TaxID=1406 RepID=UPI002AB3BC01|nr:hypothetical protein [Paenibacillus polymyxa]MDY8091549.1 hypothetical protein [Paenibacillus polymyxa]
MASEKTPNLGLNQIDRTSPKTTYFDLEKYLDQNWRAVDEFASDVNDGVNAIKKRLDTTERKTVTLEPGVQMVHAEKTAPFSLTGLSGRTLVNLLGRMGSCETVSEWSSNVAIAIDSNSKTNGSSSFKITLGSASATASASFLTTPGRKYIAIADVKSGNTSKVAISINGIAGAVGNEVTSGSVFAPSVVRFTAKDYFHIVTITGTGAASNIFNMDCVRVYEISEADYVDAASLTPAQAAAKYPYVDSVMPVRNPYAIRYGENLLPSFYEWGLHANAVVLGPNKLQLKATTGNQASSVAVPCAPGKSYKISGTIPLGTYVRVSFYDANGAFISDLFNTSITTPNNCYRMGIELQNNNAEGATGTFVFENIMLNIGSTAKPFKPREDSMLALQTDLYADPVTGANADTVFERDGQYFKSKRFESILIDGGKITKVNNIVSGTGFKALYPVVDGANYAYVGNGVGVKFDGKILPWGGQDTTADRWAIDGTAGNFAISVSVADSGWADSYPPTLDDIKAYFYGYKAYDANTITPANAQTMTTATWNGTGTKYWVQRVGAPTFTQTAPQQSYAGYTPYQLVYQLATPTVEPIVSEGQLSFVEGDNQVEVGTGIVLREKSTPYQERNDKSTWNINNGSLGEYQSSLLKYRVDRFIGIYRNSQRDNWTLYPNTVTPAGALAQRYGTEYDTSAAYTVSYLAFMSSPVVPFTGSYAANEKTLLSDLVDSVQQANTRLSVVENKKADKDNPAWISPTLLNGWATSRPVGIMKDSTGFVHIRGLIVNGLTNGGLALFTLPQGYRPISIQGPVSYGYGPSGPVLVQFDIFPDGRVCFGGGGAKDSTSVSLLFPPFIAEQ